MSKSIQSLLVFGLVVCFACGQWCSPAQAQSKAATAVEAAKVFDLSKFELIDPIDTPNSKIIAKQSYQSKSKLVDAAKKLQASLKKAGFKELEGATFTPDYGSAMYQKQGFTISVTLSPGGTPNETSVNINNHGNVDLKTMPVPKGSTVQYAMASMISYVTTLSVDEANKECKKLLNEKGWELFGDTTVSFFVKQNAVVVQVMISEAPALGNKTIIQMSSEQISADLPAPPYTGFLQYSDSTGGMLFDSDKSQDELIKFFKDSLGKSGWKPTTDNVVKIGFHDHLIFRNPGKEYLELEFYEVEGKTRTNLQYMSAEQFAEMEKREKKAMEKKKNQNKEEMDRKNNPTKVEVTVPAKASVQSSSKTEVAFSVSSGSAKSIVTDWLKSYESDGWKIEKTISEKEVGEISLTKDKLQIGVSYVDPGFIDGTITIRAGSGTQLDVKK